MCGMAASDGSMDALSTSSDVRSRSSIDSIRKGKNATDQDPHQSENRPSFWEHGNKGNLGAIDNRDVGGGQSCRNACLFEPHLQRVVKIAGQLGLVAENRVLRHIFIQMVRRVFLCAEALAQRIFQPKRAFVFISTWWRASATSLLICACTLLI